MLRTAVVGLASCLATGLPAAAATPISASSVPASSVPASPIPAAVTKLAGCYHVVLTRTAPTATDADGNSLHRTVEFYPELLAARIDNTADRYGVRENRSSGFGRLFKQAHWQLGKDHRATVVFSDGYEEWSATLNPAGSRLAGTATYTGDVEHPERHWSATASRYTCRR